MKHSKTLTPEKETRRGTLLPHQIHAEVRHLRNCAPGLMRDRSPAARRWLDTLLAQALAECARPAPLVWKYLGADGIGDRFAVGDVDAPHEFVSRTLGMRAAWLAARGGELVRAIDFVALGTRNADGIVRRAMRDFAAAEAQEHCPRLVPVLLRMKVVGGIVLYDRVPGLPELILA